MSRQKVSNPHRIAAKVLELNDQLYQLVNKEVSTVIQVAGFSLVIILYNTIDIISVEIEIKCLQ